MDLGKLFKDAWGLLLKDIGQLIVGLLLAGLIPGAAVAVVILVAMLVALPGLVSGAEAGAITGLSVAGVVALVAGYLAAVAVMVLVAIPLYAGVLTGALRRVREGRVMGYWDLFTGFRVLGRVVGVYTVAFLLVPLAVAATPVVVIGLGIAFLWVPAIVIGIMLAVLAGLVIAYLSVCWTYALIVVIDRGVGVTAALRESRALVHRVGWWWTFLALFVLQLALMAAALAAAMIPFAGMAVGLVTGPYGLTYLLAMYYQSRREDWLIAAALAAGSPPPPPAPDDTGMATTG